MHAVDLEENPVPLKKRRCRSSKKKRLRLKKRASLEPKIEGKDEQVQVNKNDPKQTQEPTQHHDKTQDYNEPKEQKKEQQYQDHKQTDNTQDHSQILTQVDDKTQVQKHDLDAEQMGAEQEDMTEYERRRRANILRNQAFMQEVGMSIAKLVARTTIGNEAEKEAKRKKLAKKREERAIQAAKMPKPAQRLSLRIKMKSYSENARARARMMASRVVDISLPVVVDHDDDDDTSERDNREEKTMESAHKHSKNIRQTQKFMLKGRKPTVSPPVRTVANSEVENDERRQELEAAKLYELQAARRDEFARRIARMVHKTESKEVDIASTNLPPTKMKTQLCGDNSLDQVQQRLDESPPNPGKKLEAKKPAISQDKVQDHHDKKSEHGEVTGYERKRQKNIVRNQAPMEQVSFTTRFSHHMQEAEKEAKRQALDADRFAQKPAQDTILRRSVRKSQQLGNEVEVNLLDRGHPLDLLSLKTRRYGNKVHFMDAMDDEGKSFLKNFTSHFKMPVALEKKTSMVDFDSIDYFLTDKDVVKTMPEPIRAIAFLPRADRVVVASGDKEGHIALWSPSNKDDSDSSVVLYRPHGFAVSQLVFPDATRLISSSYDGTVREFDLWTSKLSVVCDAGFGISAVAPSMNPQFFYAGCDDGTLRLIDRRARTLDRSGYPLHEARINTLDQHPVLNYCIVTASQDNTVCFWDKRRISSETNIPLATLPHADNVGCAYFSPRNGEWLITVSQDSYINIFDTSILSKRNASDSLPMQLRRPRRIMHNNSISSSGSKFMLHAAWDPKRTNQFVIGCMEKPPRIEIFNVGRHNTVRELTSSNFDSRHPVNVFHPYLDLIASGNSGGRVSLWRGQP